VLAVVSAAVLAVLAEAAAEAVHTLLFRGLRAGGSGDAYLDLGSEPIFVLGSLPLF
jgi:hypothetical protein